MAADLSPGDSFVLALVTSVLLIALLVKSCSRPPPREARAWAALGFSATSPVILKAAASERRQWPHWASVTNLVLVFTLAIEGCLLAQLLRATAVDDSPFDPHDALGIDTTAGVAEVKAAYRRLARELHPDKNPDPAAVGKFRAVSKAHKVLTDPAAAENFAKYGNPDGYQGFVGGFGLPSWMMADAALPFFVALVLGLLEVDGFRA